MGSFSDQINKAVAAAQGKLDQAVGSTVVLIAQQLVQRSPVGNPDTWAANRGQAYQRETYNLFAGAINANDATTSKKGRKPPFLKSKSAKALRKAFPNKSGKGYTGGRFRANWQIGVGSVDTTTTEDTDAGGNATLGRITATSKGLKAGQVVYLTNSLGYAQRLEHGWSKQAPSGMVRLTIADLPELMAQHLREIAAP